MLLALVEMRLKVAGLFVALVIMVFYGTSSLLLVDAQLRFDEEAAYSLFVNELHGTLAFLFLRPRALTKVLSCYSDVS